VLSSYEDEAGWGDFESSAEDVWGEGGWREADVKAEDEPDTTEEDVPVDAAIVVEGELDSEGDARENNVEEFENTTASTIQREDSEEMLSTPGMADHRTQPLSSTARDSESDQESSEDEAVEDVFNEDEEDQVLCEAKVNGEQDEVEPLSSHTRPLSSSSEATITTRSGSACSDRISLEQGLPDEVTHHEVDSKASHENSEVSEHAETQKSAVRADEATKARTTSSPAFQADLDLLRKIFQPQDKIRSKMDTETASEELINTTSTRKLWYRVSRPQTLRAFLSGDMEDSHVRVAWPSSRIRADTVKIVSRWMAEDRIHGRTLLGGSTKTMFGWDEPQSARSGSQATSPATSKFPHVRKQSVSMQPVAAKTSPVASFAWSTLPVSPSFPPAAEKVIASSPTMASRETPLRRSISSRPRSLVVSATSLDAVFAAETKIESKKEEPLPSSPVKTKARERVNVGLGIGTALATAADLTVAEDEDDEWGELVQSPPPSGTGGFPPHDSKSVVASQSEEWAAWETPPTLETKDTPPTSPVSSKQVFPGGPLSPARRAAFNAARVTRSLSSQHETGSMIPQPQEAPVMDAKDALQEEVNIAVPIPTPVVSPNAMSASPVAASSDDFSLFESTYGQSEAPAPSIKASAISLLSDEEARKVQSFLTHLPDLSYMFKR
jgi:hypothetical protein